MTIGHGLGRYGRWLLIVCLAWWVAGSALRVEALPRLPSRQEVASLYGDAGWQRLQQWPVLIDRLQGRSIQRQLAGVNDFFNQLRFVDDIDIWHVEDYWATPFEFLGVGAGDCEDFAMAKYLTLRELGVPDDQ